MKPSEIYNLVDPVAAFCFDRAVFLFGSTMQSDIDRAGADAKNATQANGRRMLVMAKWLEQDPVFKDPAPAKKAQQLKPGVASDEVTGPVAL